MPAIIKPLILIAAMTGASSQPGDVIFNALEDEMTRAKTLSLSGHEKPFLIEYMLHDTEQYTAAASFGALTGESCSHSRVLNSAVVLGDYKLNSIRNTMGGDNGLLRLLSALTHNRMGGAQLPVDDNYFALRRGIWLDTDRQYKSAIENFAAKKAYLATNKVMDRPDDLSKADPVVLVNPARKLSVDKAQWETTLRDMSGVFRKYPHIQRSQVLFSSGMDNAYYLESEGFKSRTSRPTSVVTLMATANREDGSRAIDTQIITTETAEQLPSPTELVKRTTELAENVEKLRGARAATEDYDGPLLLEGEASAQFLSDMVAPQLGNTQENVGFPGGSSNQWKEKLGLKVLPAFISIIDDPSAKEFNHIPIYFNRDVDDDGMRPEKLTLVDHGILKTFCMSRIPTRQLSKSNGHSVSGVGQPTNVFFIVDKPLTTKRLRQQLIQEGKDQGLKYVYIVRRLANFVSAAAGQLSDMSFLSGLNASPPLYIYQVSVADGKEELVRDITFSHLTTRVLRDIEAGADDARPYQIMSMSSNNTFIAPSILIKEIELQKRQGKPTKNEPVLPNPYFEKTKASN